MANKSLRDLLLQLRLELEKLETADDIDPKNRGQIVALEAQIHDKLKLPLEEIEEDETLLERLEEAVVELETSHSTLTAAMTHIVAALSNMGL